MSVAYFRVARVGRTRATALRGCSRIPDLPTALAECRRIEMQPHNDGEKFAVRAYTARGYATGRLFFTEQGLQS